MDDEGRGGFRLWKLIIVGFVVIIYLLYVVAVHVHGSLVSFASHLTGSEEGRAALSQGAGAVAEVIRNDDGDLTENGVIKLDSDTVLRVLDAVEEYNQNARKERTVPYEYRHYVGKVDAFDPETGEAVVSDYVTTREVTEVVGEESVLVGYELVPTGITQEEIDEMANEFYRNNPNGGTFVPPPLMHLQAQYEHREVTETRTVTETHRAVTETLTDSVTLTRSSVDNNPAIMGEDVFEVDWRPVLTLCAMIVQDKVETTGTAWDEGAGRFLTDDEINAAVTFFGYQYSYVDDATAEDAWDASYARGSARNAAYQLVVSGDPEVGEVCDFTVRRVPRIAPRLIANAYLSYEYEYEEKENGEWVLTARTARIDGSSFVMGLSEIVHDFDPQLFVSELKDLPDSGAAAIHFEEIIDGTYLEWRTQDAQECPCIGTVVTAGTGFDVSYSSLFFVGRTGLGGTFSPRGADVVSVSFTPAPEAMADAEFAAIFEKASSCLGTKYVFGGNGGPGVSFDCSSFVSYVFKECGWPVSGWPNGRENTTTLLAKSTRISEAELKPGDLIFFKGTIKDRGPNAVSHVAIWLGEDTIIHESGTAGEVVIATWSTSYLKEKHFMCFARLNKE